MEKVTIKHIAKEAGVSTGTVDRVLHGRDGVSKETEKRVMAVCEKYGYEQNVVGKALAMQKKPHKIIAVINHQQHNSFAKEVHQGLEAFGAEVKDYNIVIIYKNIVHNTIEEQLEILRSLLTEDFDGLIVKPINHPMIRFYLNEISHKGIPIVACTSDIQSVDKLCYVGQNHYRDGGLMANMLTKMKTGELRILMVVGPMLTNARCLRIDGFLSWLQKTGEKYQLCDICEASYGSDEAYQQILAALTAHPEANAIYINLPDIEPCIKALQTYGRFQGIRCSFGHKRKLGAAILNGDLDFAIKEVPFEHGYQSGQALFHYFLHAERPKEGEYIFDGEILLEQNSYMK